MKNDEIDLQVEEADQMLSSFLEEFKVLRDKYPKIKFWGYSYEDGVGEAVAYVNVVGRNVREVPLE